MARPRADRRADREVIALAARPHSIAGWPSEPARCRRVCGPARRQLTETSDGRRRYRTPLADETPAIGRFGRRRSS